MFVPGDDRGVLCHSPRAGLCSCASPEQVFQVMQGVVLHFKYSCLADLIHFIPRELSLKIPISGADLSLTKPLCCKKYFPQLHYLAKFILFYICFLSVVIPLGFE